MFKVGDKVRLKHISRATIEWMGVPWEDYHAGRIGKITYIGSSYCNIRVQNGPAWSIENEYLEPPCIFTKEMT